MHHQFAISLMALILEWSRITKEKTKHIFWNELAEEMCRLRLQKGYKTPKVPVIHETTFKKFMVINSSMFSFALCENTFG